MNEPSRAERIACQSLRAALAPLAAGSFIEPSENRRSFESAMEYVIPARLKHEYSWWRYESFDGFLFTVARKVGPQEAEFVGLCLLISDQSWTPLHLRLRVSPGDDAIEWLECKVGEVGEGNGGMVRTPYDSTRESKVLHSVAQRLDSILWAYTLSVQAPRGATSGDA